VTATLQRHLALEGTHNFRDAGGYPTRDGGSVRWRTLFRSDSLHALTPAGQQAFHALGIRSQVDVRAHSEVEQFPSVFAASVDVTYAHLPLAIDSGKHIPRANTLEELNVKLLDHAGQSIARILTSLAQPGAMPAVVNCVAGKDRTGLLIGLLLDLAGVDETTIVDDYLLTAEHAKLLLAQIVELGVGMYGRNREEIMPLMSVRPEVMAGTLAHLHERHGGAAAYMRAIGMPAETVDVLRVSLVEG
jgi:protein-tyrosine phosphatase